MKIFMWLATAVLIAIPVYGSAQAIEGLKIEDLLDSEEFGQITTPALSPDQELLVYSAKRKPTVASPPVTAVSSLFMYLKDVDLYSVKTQTLETKCITCGTGNNGAPTWSPDGRYLAFLSEKDGSSVPSLWIWERSTNTLQKVSNVEVVSLQLRWRNNTEVVCRIRTDAVSPRRDSYSSMHSLPADASESKKPSVEVFHSTLAAGPQSSPPWSLDGYTSDLTSIDVRTGSLLRLTRGSRVGTFAVAPDGTHIAFSSPLRFERPGSQQIRWDLIVLSLSTNQQRTLASDIRFEYDGSPFSWSPDSSQLAYIVGGPLESRDSNGRGDCFVVELKSGRITNVTNFTSPPRGWKQRAPLWNGGDTFYFIRNHTLWKFAEGHTTQELARIEHHRILELAGTDQARLWSPDGLTATALTYNEQTKQSGFYRIDLHSGKSTKLHEDGCFNCINTDDHIYVAPRGDKIIHFEEDAAHEPNLWLANPNFSTLRRLTHLNPQLDKYKFGKSRLVKWRGLDGHELQGALLLPADYEPTRSYPLVLWVYPGSPGSDYLNRFGMATGGPFNLQLLATRGYAVLYPDIPEDIGASMLGIAKAVLPAVNQLIDTGMTDPDRLGVMGQSFGGYATLALAIMSRRFKAAVDIDGLSNLITAYGHLEENGNSFGVSWSEGGQALMGGSPWEVRDKYIENSPYFYLDKIDTPLLIVHGTKDATVPPFLADELFVALRRLGKDVQYAKYLGENHSAIYWSYTNQVDLCRRLISFLARRLDTPGKGGGSNEEVEPAK